MKTFSERKGLKPVSDLIQINSMNEALRNSLWNTLDAMVWSQSNFVRCRHGEAGIFPFSKVIWFHYFKKPTDTRPEHGFEILHGIRSYFFGCKWNEVYDFLQFTVLHLSDRLLSKQFTDVLNVILESELSGYRLVDGHFVDVTNKEELAMVDEAARDTRFAGVSSHIHRAIELYSDRVNPDYRNSIKESISAVESIARIVASSEKATLGDALKTIEKKQQLHPALRDGFLKLYGYTSNEQGIRHAMLDEPTITGADAKFFLVSCSAFVNYLKVQTA